MKKRTSHKQLVAALFGVLSPKVVFEPKVKNSAAVSLGSLGGLASAKKLTAEQRKERATNAAKARELKRTLSSEATPKSLPPQTPKPHKSTT